MSNFIAGASKNLNASEYFDFLSEKSSFVEKSLKFRQETRSKERGI